MSIRRRPAVKAAGRASVFMMAQYDFKVSYSPCRRASSASGVSASTSSSGSSAGRRIQRSQWRRSTTRPPWSPVRASSSGSSAAEKRTGLPGFPSQQAEPPRSTAGRGRPAAGPLLPSPRRGAGQPPQQEKILRRDRGQGGKPRPDGEGQAPGAVRAVDRPGPRRLGGLKNRAIAGHDGQITVLPGPDQAGQSVQPVAEEGLSLQWTQQLVAPE